MKKIYICHPYQGSDTTDTAAPRINSFQVESIAKDVWNKGHLPIAPHFYLNKFVDDRHERGRAMKACLALLETCDEVWVYGSEVSPGMRTEIAFAESLSIPVIIKNNIVMFSPIERPSRVAQSQAERLDDL